MSGKNIALRIGEAIADHRIAVFLLTSVTLVLMADAIRRVLPDETTIDGLTWTLLLLMALAVIASVLVPGRIAPERRMFAAFVLGMMPAVSGFAGVLTGSPLRLMWTGILLSVCLVALTLATTQRRQWEPY